MEYVFRFLFGFLVTFVGCEIAIFITRRACLKNLRKLDEIKNKLTNPESYIWVNVDDRRPIHNREYLVEYGFGDYPDLVFHAVLSFNVSENRFQHEGFHGLKVVRWAELPR